MAVLNPLQAFFNTLVYRKWTAFTLNEKIQKFFSKKKKVSNSREPIERAPLLSQQYSQDYQSRSFSAVTTNPLFGSSSSTTQIAIMNH